MDKNITMDLTELIKLRLSEAINKDQLTVNIQSLLDETMDPYLKKIMIEIGAPNLKVAASIFIKRYAYLGVIGLYALSKMNRKINVSPDNITLVSHYDEKHWLPQFYFLDLHFESIKGSRDIWREQYLKELFANHIGLVIHQLSKTTKISKLILWENVAVYLFWLYENVLAQDGEIESSIQDDFKYLFYEAPGYVFGTYNHNPLTKYDSKKLFSPTANKELRIRKTCCFSYQLKDNQSRCSTCPCFQLDEEGRCQSEQSFCSTIRSSYE